MYLEKMQGSLLSKKENIDRKWKKHKGQETMDLEDSDSFNTEIQNEEVIPTEFTQRIEGDLNRCAEWLPDTLKFNYEEIKDFWDYPNVFEFLVGWSVGTCQGSYLQAFEVIYEKTPSLNQMMKIRKTVARRKIQFEQGVNAFLEDAFLKKIDKSSGTNNSIWMQTPLHNFGSKCIMNKHHLCYNPECECLCHHTKN